MNYIHSARKAKYDWHVAKIDMANVYDKINWNFLEVVLSKIKFPSHFIRFIMQMCLHCELYPFTKWSESRQFSSSEGPKAR